jgi:hypothetical protein
VPIDANFEADRPNPFETTAPEVRASWELGYHDGIRNVAPQTGQAALAAFAVGDHERTLKELRAKLALDEGQQERSKRKLKQLEEENEREHKYILPRFGRQSIGFASWLTVAFYLMLAVLAVSAEFPLSRMTVGEAIGTAGIAQMNAIRDYSIWTIAIVLCLIGFSLKPLFDVLDRGKGHFFWEAILVGASLIPCVATIYGVAQLREAISNPRITIAVSDGQQAQTGDQGGANELAEANRAADEIRKWTAFTFKWITLAMPLFSAMCLIVSLHQIHNFRRHNHAVEMLSKNNDEAEKLNHVLGELQYAIPHELEQLEIESRRDPYHSDFQGRSLAAYNHGRATGENQRLSSLPLYERLKATVGTQ